MRALAMKTDRTAITASPVHNEERVTISGVVIAFFIASLPMTMFQLGTIGSVQRPISIVMCLVAMYLLYTTRARITWAGGAALWIAYASWLVASIAWAVRLGQQLTVVFGMVLMVATFVLLAMLPLTAKDMQLIRISWIALAVFCAGLYLIYGEQAEIGERTHIILASGGSDPNEFSAYFLLPLAYCVQAALERKGPMRILAFIGTLGIVYIVLMTGSRAGAIACVLIILTIALRYAGRGFGKFVLVTLVGAVGTFIMSRLIVPLLPEGIRERLSIDAVLEDRGSAREGIWQSGIDLMATSDWRLLFGHGPNGAPLEQTVMHNHFVQALVDGGLIGLLLFLAIIGFALKGAVSDKPVFAAILGVAAMFMTLTAYSNFRPAWAILFMGLLVAKHQVQRASAKRSETMPVGAADHRRGHEVPR